MALRDSISLVIHRANVTAGLKWAPDMGAKVSMSANSTKATAMAFMNTAIPMGRSKTSMGKMVDPMATTTKNIEPMNSATRFCFNVGMDYPPESAPKGLPDL